MPNWKKVIVSGSDASLNSLFVTNAVTASRFSGSFTGSLFGTASWTSNAVLLNNTSSTVFATTSSNIFVGNQTITGSLSISGSSSTSSYLLNASGTSRLTTLHVENLRNPDPFASGRIDLFVINNPGDAGYQKLSILAGGSPYSTIIRTSGDGGGSTTMLLDAPNPGGEIYIGTSGANRWTFSGNYNSLGTGHILPAGDSLYNIGHITSKVANYYGVNSYLSSLLSVTGSAIISGSTVMTGSLNVTNGITGSLLGTASFATSASQATTASYVFQAVSASFASTASSADNFLVRGTLTAQTIVAQTITSSTDFVTGSTRFGSLISNTHQFTGSVSMTGSLTVAGHTVGRGGGYLVENTVIGFEALGRNTSATRNTAVGWYALSSSTNNGSNTAIGAVSQRFSTGGSGNTSVGEASLFGVTTGDFNSALGQSSLGGLTDGANNVAIGYYAGATLGDGTTDNTTADNSIYIGSTAYASQSNGQNEIVIGANNVGHGSNTVTLGNIDITRTILRGTVSASGNISGSNLYAGLDITAQQNLRSVNSSGDEGGEIFLSKAVTNTSITGGVTIDVWQNRLRFFEQGGTARGYYIDITNGGAGVSTNLVGGGGGGTPGGSNTQIQYNNGGAFGGVPTLTYDGTTLRATGSFTGSFTGSLLGTSSFATSASQAITASYILNAISASFATSASWAPGGASFPFTGSAVITGSLIVTGSFDLGIAEFNSTSSTTTAGTTIVSSYATASYNSAFYNYYISSGSNARAGNIMSVWSGSTINYTEVTTTDIGNTNTASFAVTLATGNVRLSFTAPGVWTVRSIVNLL
jgi:hypothetical protein